ncbi:hypothetical protein RxyAA322_18490 [Rubrobacter xylanophilus]|uniref:Spherulation-specific family 4 n=1 Tax=Rubrobacter xylanophilus TaxID=49319 RepID=A0A510HKZ8_9ACTN|nr:spherulation-specific family 4 protein [Rubrobacter xylanophilus]BBL79995.1 hypothetical protein RxyAA322_18490 [Rubrobacter xylanophilus]
MPSRPPITSSVRVRERTRMVLAALFGFPGRRGLLVALLATAALLGGGREVVLAADSQSIAVPSYFYPGSLWDRLGASFPEARLAVINPASGPGEAPNPDYAAQVRESRASGLTVLGYVHTSYAARSGERVREEIDRYYSWYGVDGIFLDEASTGCADQPYYAGLYDYIKARGGLVVLNPGTQTSECYMSAADIVVNFEGSHATYTEEYSAPAWVSGYPPERFWHLVYAVPGEAEMLRDVYLSKRRNAGWIYVTPDDLPNPWDTLPGPDYWEAERRAAADTADETPPTVSAPVENLVLSAQLGTGSSPIPVRVSWSGSDGQSGVAGYELEHSEGGGPFEPVSLPEPSATGVTLRLAPGDHAFRIRARDRAGNTGGWAVSRTFSLAASQEDGPGVTYPAGRWRLAQPSGAYGGGLRHEKDPPAVARFVFTGREVGWVAVEGPNRGRAEVWVDGVRVPTVDLYGDMVKAREVVFRRDFGERGTHSLEVRPLGSADARSTGTRIDVDAFLVLD